MASLSNSAFKKQGARGLKKQQPVIGRWYSNSEDGSLFEVVALDENDQTIEAQLVDGEICEFDFDSWDELQLKHIEAPEDWSCPFESGYDDLSDWGDTNVEWSSNPLDGFESDTIYGLYDD